MKKVKIEIKHYLTGSVLFEYECENNTIKKTLEEAVSGEADLSRADLSRADLSRANLREANLREANLREANLSRADLREANLREANLWEANLSRADLSRADLSRAKLWEANLSRADLWEAKNLNGDYTDFWWHVHHEILVEQLTEPVRVRVNYIKKYKPKEEIETRLSLLKPVLGKIPNTQKGWERLHKQECKSCPWDGKTIFPTK